MNAFKKSVIALATIATLATAAAVPAQAGSKHWKRGLAAGVGVGSAVNRLNDELAMVAVVRGLREALSPSVRVSV